MPFQPGKVSSPKGRGKGTPNKKTVEALQIAERLKCDPFEIVLLFAKGDWKALGYKVSTITKYAKDGSPYEEDVISPELRAKSAQGACEYLYPKRKAVEHDLSNDMVTHIERTILTKAV